MSIYKEIINAGLYPLTDIENGVCTGVINPAFDQFGNLVDHEGECLIFIDDDGVAFRRMFTKVSAFSSLNESVCLWKDLKNNDRIRSFDDRGIVLAQPFAKLLHLDWEFYKQFDGEDLSEFYIMRAEYRGVTLMYIEWGRYNE